MEIIVAPYHMHRSILLDKRSRDPFYDVKLITKQELAKLCFPSFRNDALIHLMKERHLNYEVSKMYLEFLPFINAEIKNPKFSLLCGLKNELIDKGYQVDLSDSRLLKNQNVEVIGYDKKDVELIEMFNRLNCHPYYANQNIEDKELFINHFEKIENEIYYALNNIASLIDSGVSLKDIYIIRRDNKYDYYLRKFGPEFGYQINIKSTASYASTGAFKEFRRLYESNHDINSSLEQLKILMKEDPLYEYFKKEVEDLIIPDIDFEIQKDYLYHRINEKYIDVARYDNAVEVKDDILYGENKHIFILGFAQGLFPKSYKDDKYLNNDELHLINRNNAKDKTKIDENLLINFLHSNNNLYLSYSDKSLSQSYYPSPLTKLLNISEANDEIADIFYSEKVLTHIYSELKDLDYYYKERNKDFYKIRDAVGIEYNTYDNSYLYKANEFNSESELKLSTTQLEQYSNCPFHYYLSRVINLDPEETIFAIELGNLAHYIFQHFREENFDFDDEFDKQVAERAFKPIESFLLKNKLKDQIREACRSIKEREKHYYHPNIYNEYELNLKLDNKTLITGKIDNLVVLDNQFAVCIDYKTGGSSSNFSPAKLKDGISTQLPTYILLVSGSEKFSDCQISGIYINHVLSDSISSHKDDDELIYDYLKLQGKTINDLSIVSKIDDTIADGVSSFIATVKLDKNQVLDQRYVISSNEFDEYRDTVKDLFYDAARKIRNNDFEISPLFSKEKDGACKYCDFKDICYVKAAQRRLPKEEEDEQS